MYRLKYRIAYWSPRYQKLVTVPEGYQSDGATGAMDIWTEAWWVHDRLCERGTWDDGSPVTNWQASSVLADILDQDGFWIRARYWWIATWLLGCSTCRKNGMWPWS